MASETWTIHIDGASRGNPGAAAFALVIDRPGHDPWEEAGCLGRTTNNIAEYTALVRALERCLELGGKRLLIHSDSELMVKQMNGLYKVKSPDLKELHQKAGDLIDRFESVKIRHVYREQNAAGRFALQRRARRQTDPDSGNRPRDQDRQIRADHPRTGDRPAASGRQGLGQRRPPCPLAGSRLG